MRRLTTCSKDSVSIGSSVIRTLKQEWRAETQAFGISSVPVIPVKNMKLGVKLEGIREDEIFACGGDMAVLLVRSVNDEKARSRRN